MITAFLALAGAGILASAWIFAYFGTYWYLYWQEKFGKDIDAESSRR